MFSNLFKKKKTSKTQSDPSHLVNKRCETVEYKPIIYYSTDKGRYITANVPVKMTLQTKTPIKHMTFENIDDLDNIYDLYSDRDVNEKTDEYKTNSIGVYSEIQEEDNYKTNSIEIKSNPNKKAINTDEDSRFSLDDDVYEMVYGGSYSKNLDYIMTHFNHDVENGVYHFNHDVYSRDVKPNKPISYYSCIDEYI
jgi:hypothetical protein